MIKGLINLINTLKDRPNYLIETVIIICPICEAVALIALAIFLKK